MAPVVDATEDTSRRGHERAAATYAQDQADGRVAVRSAYEVLGVTPETPFDVAAATYREQRQRILDTSPEQQPGAQHTEQLAALDWAWRVLSDAASRLEHDRWLATGGSYGAQPLGPYGGTPTPPPAPPPAGPAPGWGPPVGQTPELGPPGQWGPDQWARSTYPPLPKPKRRTWAIVVGAVLVVLVLGVIIASAVDFFERQQVERVDGRIVEPGTVPHDELLVGDCFDDPSNLGDEDLVMDVFSVEAVPCDQPHDNEVFQILEMDATAGEEYPGDEAVSQRALRSCVPGFEEFIGISIMQTQLDAMALFPNRIAWGAGDRRVLCATYDPQGPVTGTLEGAAR